SSLDWFLLGFGVPTYNPTPIFSLAVLTLVFLSAAASIFSSHHLLQPYSSPPFPIPNHSPTRRTFSFSLHFASPHFLAQPAHPTTVLRALTHFFSIPSQTPLPDSSSYIPASTNFTFGQAASVFHTPKPPPNPSLHSPLQKKRVFAANPYPPRHLDRAPSPRRATIASLLPAPPVATVTSTLDNRQPKSPAASVVRSFT
ncbi:unnamed protein product, partial [Sphenostylis stenocarpa]